MKVKGLKTLATHLRRVLCTYFLLVWLVLLIAIGSFFGCTPAPKLRDLSADWSRLSDEQKNKEDRIRFFFGYAMAEHNSLAYELSEPTLHPLIDEWFRVSEPLLVHGRSRPNSGPLLYRISVDDMPCMFHIDGVVMDSDTKLVTNWEEVRWQPSSYDKCPTGVSLAGR